MEIVCKKCNQLKKYIALGLCQTCYSKEYYQKHKKRMHQWNKKYYQEHKKQIKKRHQERRNDILKYMKEYHEKNKEKKQEYRKEHYYNNGGKITIKAKSSGRFYFFFGGGKAVHRAIAEKALGRKLTKNEHVHHLNQDTLDNRNCNLLICSRSFHAWLHQHKYNNKKSVNKC